MHWTPTSRWSSIQTRPPRSRRVRASDVDVALIDQTVVWRRDRSDINGAIVASAAQAAATEARAGDAGISDEGLADLLQPISLEDRFLEPEDSDRAGPHRHGHDGVVLLFLAIQNYGNMVLMGVIEEKSSRVVEVLLNHVRPRHLLAGKVLGIGARTPAADADRRRCVGCVGLGERCRRAQRADRRAPLVRCVWFLLGFGLTPRPSRIGWLARVPPGGRRQRRHADQHPLRR